MERVMAFPGVGTHYGALASDFSALLSVFPHLAEQFSEVLGCSLQEVVDNLEVWGQRPRWGTVIGVIYGILLGHAWIDEHGPPDAFTGLSNGMYVACALSGALSSTKTVDLCYQRGRLIEQMTDGRTMMTGIVDEIEQLQLEAIVDEVQSENLVEITGYNTPSQFVVGGTAQGVRSVLEKALARHGSLIFELGVPVAFHSSLMQGVNDRYVAEVLSQCRLTDPRSPVVSSISGDVLDDGPSIRSHLARLLNRPVRFADVVHRCRDLGVEEWIIGGPGRTVLGLLPATEKTVLATRLSEVIGR